MRRSCLQSRLGNADRTHRNRVTVSVRRSAYGDRSSTSTRVSGPAVSRSEGQPLPTPAAGIPAMGSGAAGSFGSVVVEVVGPVPGPVRVGAVADEGDSNSGVEVFELAGSAVEPDRPGPGGEVKEDVSERAVSGSGVENNVAVELTEGEIGCFEVEDP
jgi:PPE-repeat protein